MIYVVLGMHKSGTTLVAEILHKSGIPMIGDQDGDPSYEKGNKYERTSTAHLNKDILNSWDVESFCVRGWKELDLSAQQRSRMVEIIQHCQSSSNDWGIKDPRMCLTYELWEPHLPQHKIIAVYRRPAQVWHHYRSWRYFFAVWEVLRAWRIYNRKIIDILSNTKRDYILLDYEGLMLDGQGLRRLNRFVGRNLTDARKDGAFRKRARGSVLIAFVDAIGGLFGFERASQLLRDLEELRKEQHSEAH